MIKGNSTVACNATQPWLSYEKVNLHNTPVTWAWDGSDLTSQFAMSSLLILESLKIWECPFALNVHHGEQGWCSYESTRLPLMWPTFSSWLQCFMLAEFVVGSLPSPGRFSPGTPVFPSAQKPKLPNFNLIWKAWTCLNKFLGTLNFFMVTQMTIFYSYGLFTWRWGAPVRRGDMWRVTPPIM